MSEFIYVIAEGVQDVAFLCRLLTLFYGGKRIRLMEELSPSQMDWMKSFSWPLRNQRGTEIDRFSVPAPTFYRLGSGATVALRSAEGITKIRDTLDIDHEAFKRSAGAPETIGILLDSDDKPFQDRVNELRKALRGIDLNIPQDVRALSTGSPRIGVFAVPEPGLEGTLEDLLLQVGEVTFSELTASARGYAEEWRKKAVSLSGADWKPIKKPAGGKKAAIAAMTAILKPGYAVQNSIEQTQWMNEESNRIPCLQPCLAFLNALLAPAAPSTEESGGHSEWSV